MFINPLLESQLKRNNINLSDLQDNILKLLNDVSKSYDQQEVDHSYIGRSAEPGSMNLPNCFRIIGSGIPCGGRTKKNCFCECRIL